MENADGTLIVIVSTLLALGVGMLLAGTMLGCAKMLIRLGRRTSRSGSDESEGL